MTDDKNEIEPKDVPVTEAGEKLSRKTKLFYASGSISEVIMGNIVAGLAMPIYQIGLGVHPGLISLALGIPRVWDAVTDPIIANISDNAHTRFGRRKPFILVGTILTALFCILLWIPPVKMSEHGLFLYFLIISMFYFTTYTVFTIPFHALGPELTRDYSERIRLMGYKTFLMGLGGTLFLPWAYKLSRVLGKSIQGDNTAALEPEIVGVRIVGAIYAVLMVIFIIFPLVFTKEKYANANKERISLIKAMKCTFKNKPFAIVCTLIVTTMFGAYLVQPLGMYINLSYIFSMNKDKMATMIVFYSTVYGIVSMAAVPLISFIGTRIGKKRTLIGGLALVLFSYLISWFVYNPRMPYLQLLHAVIAAPGMSCLWLMAAVFIADISDYDELNTGLRREGMYTAMFGWCMKASYAGVTALAGFIIAWTGFNEKLAEQSAQTIMRLRLSFMLVPVLFLLLAIYLVSRYPLNRKTMEQIQAELSEKRKNRKSPMD